MRTLSLFLLLSLNSIALGQRPYERPLIRSDRLHFNNNPSPTDSADFARFLQAVESATPDSTAPPDLRNYRLVWDVGCEGQTWLQRGNGTDLPTFLKDPPEKRFTIPVCCPQFRGGRYSVVHWEPHTGLVRYHYWFFERVE